MITGRNWYGEMMVLVEDTDRVEAKAKGDFVVSSRGTEYELLGGTAPHKPSSTGRIRVRQAGHNYPEEFYPSVCGLIWIYANDYDRCLSNG